MLENFYRRNECTKRIHQSYHVSSIHPTSFTSCSILWNSPMKNLISLFCGLTENVFIFENKIEIRYSLLRSWKCARVGFMVFVCVCVFESGCVCCGKDGAYRRIECESIAKEWKKYTQGNMPQFYCWDNLG